MIAWMAPEELADTPAVRPWVQALGVELVERMCCGDVALHDYVFAREAVALLQAAARAASPDLRLTGAALRSLAPATARAHVTAEVEALTRHIRALSPTLHDLVQSWRAFRETLGQPVPKQGTVLLPSSQQSLTIPRRGRSS